jgi:colanic acid biosynthesis glycosyl transferase WcaI
MRLLIVTQYFWPEDFRVNDLALGMRERGHSVTVLTGLPNYPDGTVFEAYKRDPDAFARFGDIEVIRVPLIPRGSNAITLLLNYLSFAVTGSVLGSWALRGRGFDAIFVFQGSPVIAALPALLFRTTKRAPVIMWILDIWPDTLSALGVVRSPAILNMVGAMVRFIYRRCDRILVQSRAFFENVERHGGRTETVRYLPNWVEPTFDATMDGVSPAPETLPYRGTFTVMFAGNVGEAQDMPAILDAAEAAGDLEGLRWLIVGDGRAMEGLKADIERRQLADRVHLLGRHAVERMPAFFAGADTLLVSLRPEPIFSMTIPGKVQSYLATGRPVLGMIDGEGARVIRESGGGLAVPAGDGAGLAAAVRELMAMTPAARAAMGQNGRDYAAQHFGREALFDQLEGWFGEVRSRGPAPAE